MRYDNAIDWLLWSLFSSGPGEGIEEQFKDELDYYASSMKKIFGYALRPGRNAGKRVLRLTVDPVIAVHRPLILYIVS
jgi:hypothetical protein